MESDHGKEYGCGRLLSGFHLQLFYPHLHPVEMNLSLPIKTADCHADAESIIAERNLEKYFPADGGLPLFAVFHNEEGLTDKDILGFSETLESLQVDATLGEVEVVPLTKLPPEDTGNIPF